MKSDAPLAARLTLAVLVALSVAVAYGAIAFSPGCKSTQVLTPQEQARDDDLERGIQADKSGLSPIEKDAADKLRDLEAAKVAGDAPRIASALQAFEAVRADWLRQSKAMEAKIAEQSKLYDDALQREKTLAGQVASAAVPAAPWLAIVSTLAGVLVTPPLLFKRPREHVADAGRSLAGGDVKDFAAYIGKAYGLVHSNSDPMDILNAAASVAAAGENLPLATKLRAVHDELENTTPPALAPAA